ncbi:unnamed protein product [Rotaria socialis]|uniref:Uncharacterized protein n=1 Tax=Rotaria socialis TaxID=392032 RepID=A0A818BM77_9BILA|nr:unnamed protein product [Rotaria socialis]
MTGSVPQLTRQHSSAVDHSKMNKSYPPQFRRCLSTNDQDSIKLIFNDDQLKENLYSLLQKSSIDDDDDSGTEEIEQQHQLEHIFLEPCNDNENQLSIKSFGPNPDEGFSECETQDEIKVSFIKNDLKLAQSIADSTKQSFCPDTCVAFHGEFARRISIPLSLCHRVHEVCRVMKNLALFIFERYFPDMINTIELENNITPSRASRHDPTQRKGRMLAPHIKKHYEACRRGLCFV